jgi:hypothetical protein
MWRTVIRSGRLRLVWVENNSFAVAEVTATSRAAISHSPTCTKLVVGRVMSQGMASRRRLLIVDLRIIAPQKRPVQWRPPDRNAI